jgi:hypothetical protein
VSDVLVRGEYVLERVSWCWCLVLVLVLVLALVLVLVLALVLSIGIVIGVDDGGMRGMRFDVDADIQ